MNYTLQTSHRLYDHGGFAVYAIVVQKRRRVSMAEVHHPLRANEPDELYHPTYHGSLHIL